MRRVAIGPGENADAAEAMASSSSRTNGDPIVEEGRPNQRKKVSTPETERRFLCPPRPQLENPKTHTTHTHLESSKHHAAVPVARGIDRGDHRRRLRAAAHGTSSEWIMGRYRLGKCEDYPASAPWRQTSGGGGRCSRCVTTPILFVVFVCFFARPKHRWRLTIASFSTFIWPHRQFAPLEFKTKSASVLEGDGSSLVSETACVSAGDVIERHTGEYGCIAFAVRRPGEIRFAVAELDALDTVDSKRAKIDNEYVPSLFEYLG